MQVNAELPIYIDSTMMSTFRACPKKFYREFVLGLRGMGTSVDLHAGGCFAAALESFYEAIYVNHKPFDLALAHAYKRFLTEWGDFEPIKDTPKTKVNVWAAVEDYLETYPPLTDKVQPYIVGGKPSMEFTFAIPLEPATHPLQHDNLDILYDKGMFPLHPVTGEPFLYSGRFDMLGELGKRPVWRDEKTTTSIGASWSEQWDLRGQFSGYTWALQHHGFDTDTGVIRGIGILKTKFHQVEAIKQYSKANIARWHEQLRRDLWRLVRMWNEGYWDYNLGETCNSYGGCGYRALCNSPDETRWYDNYVVRRWNPTLKNPLVEGAVAA